MKKNKKEKIISTPSSDPIYGQPETAFEMINKYGTYEIQPTADTLNTFPAIAQGYPEENKSEKRQKKK